MEIHGTIFQGNVANEVTTLLTLVLYSLSYSTHSHTLLTLVLYSLSYSTHSRSVLTLVL
jgi:hypothetical protein